MATTMTREEEIKTLQSLKGNTYFGQIFDNDTIDRMCDNIKNDFGIECGVELLEKSKRVDKAESDKRRLMHENRDLQDVKDKLMHVIFEGIYANAGCDYIEKQLELIIGKKDVIVYKLKYGVGLNDKECEFVIDKLNF